MKRILLLIIFFGLIIIVYVSPDNLRVSKSWDVLKNEVVKPANELERYNYISQNVERYSTPYSCEDCNVVLISIDTLRADHTGFMGYFRNTTPNLDNLAKDSIVFDNAFVQAPYTPTSHASIFTALYPFQHGVLNSSSKLKNKTVTLAELMKINGYETAAFVGDGAVSSRFGFSRGFKLYHDAQLYLSDTIPLSMNWLENNKNKKFFLFIHGYELHSPYGNTEFSDIFVDNYNGEFKGYKEISVEYIQNITKNKNLSEDDINYIKAKYDGDIRQADKYIGMLIDKLKNMNLYNKTILIIFSDHGEYMGDHPKAKDAFGHFDLYDPVLRQVLIIKHAKFDFPKRVKQVASSIDISPTVLELAGIGSFKQFEGKSLINAILNENPDSFSISDFYGASIRTSKWRFIARANGLLELYDVENDKNNANNAADRNPVIVSRFIKILENAMSPKDTELPEQINISDSRLIENLKRLGYIA